MVEYAVDFYILRPVNPSRGNKVMVFDVTNRGNKMTYLPLSFPFRAPGRYLPNNDPCGPDDAGTGLLMRQGGSHDCHRSRLVERQEPLIPHPPVFFELFQRSLASAIYRDDPAPRGNIFLGDTAPGSVGFVLVRVP